MKIIIKCCDQFMQKSRYFQRVNILFHATVGGWGQCGVQLRLRCLWVCWVGGGPHTRYSGVIIKACIKCIEFIWKRSIIGRHTAGSSFVIRNGLWPHPHAAGVGAYVVWFYHICHVLTIVLVCFPCFSLGQDVSWVGILCCVYGLSISMFGLIWFSIRGRC